MQTLPSDMKPILEVQHISKRYSIQHLAGGYLSLRERMQSFFRFEKSNTEDFWALKDVSFEVQAGESIGIIGRNGAGKSTLLKILSKITPPTSGKVITRGRIASLLEVGTGFHPELTGRENIFFNGSLLGMKRIEITAKFDEIVDFSGVEKFLDTPLKHYSSGMQLRLAFAVAAFLEPEILIIDEVLAVGDAEFQKKCLGKMEDVSKSGRTILFVSHNMSTVNALCSRAIVLNNGIISNESNAVGELILNYLSSVENEGSYKGVKVNYFFDENTAWDTDTFLNIKISWNNEQINKETCIDLACYTFDGVKVFAFQSEKITSLDLEELNPVIFRIKNPGFSENALFFDIGFRQKGDGNYFILNQKCFSVIPGPGGLPGYSRNDVVIVPKVEIKF